MQFNSQAPILLVFGKLCSGKGTLSKSLINRTHIVTSDIVSKVCRSTIRSEMQDTKQLDNLISHGIIDAINNARSKKTSHDKIVVDGIRQLSIVKSLVDFYGADQIDMVYLNVPEAELKRRFVDRKDRKDNLSFEELLKRDDELGFSELEPWLLTNSCVNVINF